MQFSKSKNGGADRDRTDDIQLAKLALSQLSYSPRLLAATNFAWIGKIIRARKARLAYLPIGAALPQGAQQGSERSSRRR